MAARTHSYISRHRSACRREAALALGVLALGNNKIATCNTGSLVEAIHPEAFRQYPVTLRYPTRTGGELQLLLRNSLAPNPHNTAKLLVASGVALTPDDAINMLRSTDGHVHLHRDRFDWSPAHHQAPRLLMVPGIVPSTPPINQREVG